MTLAAGRIATPFKMTGRSCRFFVNNVALLMDWHSEL